MSRTAVSVLLLICSCASSTEQIVQECAQRVAREGGHVPRHVALGVPLFLSVDIPAGWSIEPTNLESLDNRGLPLNEIEVHPNDPECASLARLNLARPAGCSDATDLSQCFDSLMPAPGFAELAEQREIELPAGTAREFYISSIEFSHAPGPLTFHYVLIPTARGTVSCSLTARTGSYREHRQALSEFCGSVRLQ
jgi:hypothetical protein